MASPASEKEHSTSNNYSPAGDIERGGTMRTPQGPTHPSRIGNPGPMTLRFRFDNIYPISYPNVVVGMIKFAGGLTQFIAAMWEFPRGNTFGAIVGCVATNNLDSTPYDHALSSPHFRTFYSLFDRLLHPSLRGHFPIFYIQKSTYAYRITDPIPEPTHGTFHPTSPSLRFMCCLHTHPCPVFASYGSFWMSYGTIFIPSSGIFTAYSDPKELGSALEIYLLAWDMVTVFFLLVVIRSSVGGQFSGSLMVTKVGGAFGIIGALIAYFGLLL
ncbi:hypothetical protein C8R44DRAFT_987478 [Mycena epipterygia]|nr:hypothetical protein C8R44DRAFT_987478 [Mycena epipterygia]